MTFTCYFKLLSHQWLQALPHSFPPPHCLPFLSLTHTPSSQLLNPCSASSGPLSQPLQNPHHHRAALAFLPWPCSVPGHSFLAVRRSENVGARVVMEPALTPRLTRAYMTSVKPHFYAVHALVCFIY